MTDASQLKRELTQAYEQFYVAGFKNNDITLIDQIVRYPITYLKNGQLQMLDQFPINPGELREKTGWDHSRDWHFEIQAINEQSAHAIASATRCKADGSVIEHVHGFYGFARENDTWKMYALAELVY